MQIYLVGGAVRDKLLQRAVHERDWVVVGATPQEMLSQGYRQVGKDFPVFLHPESNEEYALARTERKTAPGYYGFDVQAAPDVSLEEDLLRRDLTINAIAEGHNGQLIDPFNGQQDIKNRVLRHVSPAFSEDPVRILRLARFAARFAHLGFSIADETMTLMREMVENGEVDALVAERVWTELDKALREQTPSRFIEVLRECGALARLFPEIDHLFGVPQPAKYHPEIDTGLHTMMALQQAARLSSDNTVRFAALMHDLGKGDTDPELWPKHHAHEQRGVPLVEALCERFRVPNEYKELALMVTRYHGKYHRAGEMRPGKLLQLLEDCDALRRPQRFELFLIACEADSRGRTGFEGKAYSQPALLKAALNAAQRVTAQPFIAQELKGVAIKEAMQQARIQAIQKITSKQINNPPQPL
ncbi:MAG: multifunctional CCA addition/repair protein [Gammaproteobacteria bacterium]|nr:multifunctional CCA addition/repair protein [Gammaproteobacteria bacterium]MCF6230637.1 multifunctional CCA addition/repair protein [Gammaproteobacteria bacterium]